MSQASYATVARWLVELIALTRARQIRWTRYMRAYYARQVGPGRLRVEVEPADGRRPWQLRIYAPTGTQLLDLAGDAPGVRRTRIPALIDQLTAELPTAP